MSRLPAAALGLLMLGPASSGPQDLSAALRDLMGIPYAEDAGLDAEGRFVRFTPPGASLPAPGLNCSGFAVAAARRLLGFQGSLAEAGRDRLGDSGAGSPGGQDWDFGWDLVLNLSEGRQRRWVLPEGDRPAPGASGRALQGFRVQDREAWTRLSGRWRKDRVYFATLHRGSGRGLRHHHVALLLRSDAGLGFYQTLPGGRVHRLALDTPEGMDRLRAMFGPGERILILEIQI
ncbi:MAG: hypothetical protein HY014_03560 [Acidobacteria bacterium]|nr:hypothetical protein [Acidobacteriota bacterium]MBI3487229.1 hypothetical protein [Acidobacteriota bacterium]